MDIVFWIIDGAVPLTLIVLGVFFLRRPMDVINPWQGYRSARATASPAAYRHANRLLGRLAVILGAGLLLLSAAAKLMVALPEWIISLINLGTQLAGAGALFGGVEVDLRRRFDGKGRPRQPRKKKK